MKEVDDWIDYFNTLPMRDTNRHKRILDKLLKLWTKFPDTRLNQLMHLVNKQHSVNQSDFFYLEDTKFEENLDELLVEYNLTDEKST